MITKIKKMSKRLFAGFLAVILVATLFPTTFASAASSDYSTIEDLDGNLVIDALTYLDYDLEGLNDAGLLFQRWSGDYVAPYLSPVKWASSGLTGRETTAATSSDKSATGLVPNVSLFEKKGFDCGAFVTYFYYNYLLNIEGMDNELASLKQYLPSGSCDPDTWVTALNKMVSAGTAEKVADISSSKNSAAVSDDVWNSLTAGDILIFRNETYDHAHIGIFVGMYDCRDQGKVAWMTHQSSSKGACFVPVYSVEKAADEKEGLSLHLVYRLDYDFTTKPQGEIQVTKSSANNGSKLSGAIFTAKNNETGETYVIGPTDAKGFATSGEVPYGQYTITETVAPTNYSLPSGKTWTATVSDETPIVKFDITNELLKGKIAVQKVDSLQKPLEGVEFTIYSDASCTKAVEVITTGADGVATSKDLNCTYTYYVKETKVNHPDYVLDSTVYPVAVPANDTGWVNNGNAVVNYLKKGAVGIKKVTEENAPFQGVVFGVFSDTACTKQITTVTTDANGVAVYGLNADGSYAITCRQTLYFKELQTDADYALDENVYPVTVQADSTTYANNGVPVVNYLKYGAIGVKKTDEEGNGIAEVAFAVYRDKECTSRIGIFVTDVNGNGTYGVEADGSYALKCQQTVYVREIAPADNTWLYDNTVYPVTVNAGKVTLANGGEPIVNIKKQWQVKFLKVDSVNGELAAGEATIEGAVYGLYNSNNDLLDTYTVNCDGYFITNNYPVGTGYYLKEIEAPTGYAVDTTVYSLDEYSVAVDMNTPIMFYEATLYENAITGTISLRKFTANRYNPSDYNVPEEGAEFQVYLKSAGSYANAVASKDSRTYDSGVADKSGNVVWSNGQIISKELVYGTYIVHQTKSWDNRIMVDDFEVVITDENQHFDLSLNNPYYSASVVVNKKDAESELKITGDITTFKIMDLTTNEYVSFADDETGELVSEFHTVDGTMTLPMELPYGEYRIDEISPPAGYMKNEEGITFEINADSHGVINLDFFNAPIKTVIQIEKKGTQFASVTQSETEYGTLYAPTYAEDYLAGVTFDVIANEDIYSGDGMLKFTAETVVDTVVTKDSGPVCTTELYPGEYKLVEKAAPDGVIMSEDPIIVTVSNESDAAADIEIVSITNDCIPTSITMMKRAYVWSPAVNEETGEITRDVTMVAGVDFTFGIYANQDFVANDGTTIAKDSLVAIMRTRATGFASYSENLPYGLYYTKELDTPNTHAYIKDTSVYEIDLRLENAKNNKVVSVVNNGEPIVNDFIKIETQIKKTDFTTAAPVKGALVTIKNEAGETLYSIYTNEDGELPGVVLEPGKYTFTEDLAPAGYIREPSTFEFVVNEDGTIEGTTEFTNEQTFVELFKVDTNTREYLANAEIHVLDSNGQIVFTGITDENGRIAITGVLNADETYTFVEATAPDGYTLNAETYSFSINADGTVSGITTIENEKTRFVIHKTDKKGVILAGAEFTMYDASGNVIDVKVTDENGEAVFEGFGRGEFTIKETKAPEGFLLSDKTITIVNDGTWDNYSGAASFTMVNEPIEEIPETGDNVSNKSTHISFMLLTTALFAAVYCILAVRKKVTE